MFLASLPVTKHNRSLRSPRGWIGLQEQGTRGPPAAPLWGCPGDLQRPLERHADAEGSRVWVKDTDVASTTHPLQAPCGLLSENHVVKRGLKETMVLATRPHSHLTRWRLHVKTAAERGNGC